MAFSGAIDASWTPSIRCSKCGKALKSSYVTVCKPRSGTSTYCYGCAEYDKKTGFCNRENWIRQELNVTDDIPTEALIDLCEENYRKADAEYLRKFKQ